MKTQIDSKLNTLSEIFKSLHIRSNDRIKDILNFQRYVIDNFPQEILSGINISAGRSGYGIEFNTKDYIYWKQKLEDKSGMYVRPINQIKLDFYNILIKKLESNSDLVDLNEVDALFDQIKN